MGCSVDQSLDDLNDFVNFLFCGVRKAVLYGIKRGKIGIVLESTNWVSRSCCFSHQYCERRNISQSNPKKNYSPPHRSQCNNRRRNEIKLEGAHIGQRAVAQWPGDIFRGSCTFRTISTITNAREMVPLRLRLDLWTSLLLTFRISFPLWVTFICASSLPWAVFW